MKKNCQKVLSVMLCVVIAFSCCAIPANAVVFETAITGSALAVAKWLGVVGAEVLVGEAVSRIADYFAGKLETVDFLAVRANIEAEGNRAETTKDVLHWIAYDWNANYAAKAGFNVKVVQIPTSTGEIYSAILCLVNPTGQGGRGGSGRYFEHYFADEYGRILCSNDTTETDGTWKPIRDMSSTYYMLTKETLYNKAVEVGGVMQKSGTMYFIHNKAGTQVYVSPDGYPFAAWANEDGAAVNQDRPTSSGTVTDSAGNTTNIEGDLNYNTSIDMSGGTVSFPDGVVEELNSIIYDQSTRTYYVDSRDFSTTYNQSFSFYQYHINYTSVTYIGQTEEYNKYYEAYYELPDGRDSADLTKEDLEQLSTTFADVVNYARSTDNVDQRVLYHFDGDTQDASYWSYTTSFDWATGASLTYMDEGVFSGSLYLDETEHDFTISLPGNDAAGDFTLQFRYYQSYTAAPQTDSWIQIGDEKLLSFSGAMYLDKNGAGIVATSIGVWNEICIIRSDNVLYYYINGVFYKSVADNTYHKPTLRFYFGDDQQTYKKLDELRFTKSVVYTVGEDYTVSSVPFDSSLSLILPDGERPMADEVLVITPSENNLFNAKGLADWSVDSTLSKVEPFTTPASWSTQHFNNAGYTLFVNDSYTTLTAETGFTSLSVKGVAGTTDYLPSSYSYNAPWKLLANGLYLPVSGYRYDSDDGYTGSAWTNFTYGKKYLLTVVLVDGTSSKVEFSVGSSYTSPSITKTIGSTIDFDLVDLYSKSNSYDSRYMHRYGIRIFPVSGHTPEILYMELVEGIEPQFQVGWETAMYSSGQLEDSPVLAVRSNIDVTTYQIGGVRPSYPAKGQVYAMVENGYITSLQIYSGTGWENVDGRIWTGSRWIPASSYNVITLQDMYDIADATPDYEYIYTESGFWDWWQRSWTDFVDKFFGQKGSGSSGAAGSIPADVLPAVPDDESTEEADGWNVLDLVVVMKDGAWSVITGVVTTAFDSFGSFASGIRNIGNFFAVYDRSNPTCITGMCDYGGDDIWA